MTDFGYDPESLRHAGARHRSTGTSAADLGGFLERIALDPTALGDVAHAAAFHWATMAARDTQAGEPQRPEMKGQPTEASTYPSSPGAPSTRSRRPARCSSS
jgi:hypothetical protein